MKYFRPIEDRFFEKVKKTKTCWIWIASLYPNNYGKFWIKDNKSIGAHRFSWELHNGSIINKLQVLHKCDNPSCVNPKHLFLGTQLDNMRDKVKKKRHVVLKGEEVKTSKLTIAQVKKIRDLYSKGNITQKELSKQFKVCRQNINMIVNNKRWLHI